MKKVKISLVLNIIIVLFTIFASFCMFTGYKFMHGQEIVLEATNLQMFKFFTVDSNMFMGLIALIFAYYDYILLKKEKNKIPKFMYILKLMATTGVALTFVVVFTYLGPITKYSLMIQNSNLFFHLITPLLSMITFMFFEKTNKLNLKDTLYGLIPMGLYALYYVSNVLIHMHNGKVSTKYDFYWFVQRGVWTIIIIIPLMLIVTYGISFVLWKVNKEK